VCSFCRASLLAGAEDVPLARLRLLWMAGEDCFLFAPMLFTLGATPLPARSTRPCSVQVHTITREPTCSRPLEVDSREVDLKCGLSEVADVPQFGGEFGELSGKRKRGRQRVCEDVLRYVLCIDVLVQCCNMKKVWAKTYNAQCTDDMRRRGCGSEACFVHQTQCAIVQVRSAVHYNYYLPQSEYDK